MLLFRINSNNADDSRQLLFLRSRKMLIVGGWLAHREEVRNAGLLGVDFTVIVDQVDGWWHGVVCFTGTFNFLRRHLYYAKRLFEEFHYFYWDFFELGLAIMVLL